MRVELALAFAVAFTAIVVLATVVVEQKRIIQDQREYIAAGCHGRYQGRN